MRYYHTTYFKRRWLIQFDTPTSGTLTHIKKKTKIQFEIQDNYAITRPTEIPKWLRHYVENIASKF